jgi:hypothetical protein
MHILQSYFCNIIGPGRHTWDEPEEVKQVRFYCSLRLVVSLTTAQLTVIHNMTTLSDDSNYWDGPAMKAQNLLGVWFAASHQPWMNLHFILLELCVRPDWQKRLRHELQNNGQSLTYKTLDSLPFLDSFIKETVRLNPLDRCKSSLYRECHLKMAFENPPTGTNSRPDGIRRKAVKPYTFMDRSVTVPQGTTICVPAYDILHDEKIYPKPDNFDGERFLPRLQETQSRFTTVSHQFPMWGYGSLAWYVTSPENYGSETNLYDLKALADFMRHWLSR